MQRAIVFVLALMLGGGSGAVLGQAAYSDLVVFGDSLSDNGNFYEGSGSTIPPSPPYWEGRFSNGPVWVEELAAPLGLDGATTSNFAVGYATTEDVLTLQVTPFVSGGSVPPDALYVVWAGANDFLEDVPDPQGAIEAAMNNLGGAISALALAGAVDIMVPNMPNLGGVPRMLETGDPEVIGGATALSGAFNDALSLTIATLEADLGIDIIEVDTFDFMEQIVADPASFNLTNVTERALAADGTVVPNPEEYLFWDEMHPTAAVHALLADSAFAALPEADDTDDTAPVDTGPGDETDGADDEDTAPADDTGEADDEDTAPADDTDGADDEDTTPTDDTISAQTGGGARSSDRMCGLLGTLSLPLTLLTMVGLRRRGPWRR